MTDEHEDLDWKMHSDVPLFLVRDDGEKQQVGTADVMLSPWSEIRLNATITDEHLSELITGSTKQNPLFKIPKFSIRRDLNDR
jgi:hypothetical protein